MGQIKNQLLLDEFTKSLIYGDPQNTEPEQSEEDIHSQDREE